MSWTLAIGAVTIGHGQDWLWVEDTPDLLGWEDVRTADDTLPGAWGEQAGGPDLPNGRDLTFAVWSQLTTTATDAQAAYDQLTAEFRVAHEDVDVILATPARTYLARGRVRRVKPDLTDVEQGIITAAVQIRCLDPRLYDVNASSALSSLSSASGGMDFPAAFPISFGSVTPGRVELINAGNAPAGLTCLMVPGASGITDPTFELTATHERLVFAGLTVIAGQYLGIDWGTRSAYLADSLLPGAARTEVSNYIDRTQSAWWTNDTQLPAGTNEVQFSAAGGAGSVLYSYRSAWLI